MRVSKSLVARFGTVVAAAGIALGSVAATADASTAHHKVKTQTILTGSAKPVHVNKHHPFGTAHIVGQLTTPGTPAGQVTGVRVNLWREGAKGRWHEVQHARTGFHGFVRFRVYHVAKGATFQLRFPGNRNFARSRSSVIVISAVS
jgi:hypothetical protein